MKTFPIQLSDTKVQNTANCSYKQDNEISGLVSQIGKKTMLPDRYRNYAVLNQELVSKLVSKREAALPAVANFLSITADERSVTEGLYIIDRMIDAGVKGVEKTYPIISRFNRTNSPNIQVMLAGIYRKTQVPDAFGPLMSMMIRNTFYPHLTSFDPNEEVGGAILEYLRNKNARQVYQN